MRAPLLLVAVLALVSGCPPYATGALADAPPPSPDPVAVTPGCAVNAIVVDGDTVCATCNFGSSGRPGDDTRAVCGVADEAPCETRQNSSGRACQLCVTADGSILYDDCFTSEQDAARAARCEETPGAGPDEVCATCFDDDGAVVSSSCHRRDETCVDVVVDGLPCRRCTSGDPATGGVSVESTTCAQVDIDPSACRRYADADGSCIDCLDAAGALLTHRCSAEVASGGACEQTFTSDGLVCFVCFDGSGAPLSQSCEAAPPQPERCAQLDYSEQSCFVCVDGANAVVLADCRAVACDGDANAGARPCRVDADCGDPGLACFDGSCVAANPDAPVVPVSPCAAPPPCTTSTDANGDVCRTCPRSDGVLETRCLSASPLACEVLPEDALPPSGSEADPAPQGRTCTLCRAVDSGVEVYRDCDGNGAIPPPACADEVRGDGAVCEVCRDAVTAAIVYQACPDETCLGEAVAPLVSSTGNALLFGDARVVAHCRACDAGGEGFLPGCFVDGVCAVDDVGAVTCPTPARLRLAPRSCGAPWQAYVAAGGGRDAELRGLLSWALEVHGLRLFAVEVTSVAAATCEACTCERGDRIEVTLAADDLQRARVAFADALAP